MKTSGKLLQGQVYTRRSLKELFDISDATINNGVFKPKTHNSVWLFVTENKTADRTQYHDLLDRDILYWDSQTSGKSDHLIIDHKLLSLELLLFYRKEKYEFPGAGFKYEGRFEYESHTSAHPAHFILRRENPIISIIQTDLESQATEEQFFEGTEKQRFSNYYERNLQLRMATITLHGWTCMICGFNFQEKYGVHGEGYIEVHHLKPLSSLKETTKIDPQTDMIVVCSNCHRMLHRKRDQVLNPDELRALIKSNIVYEKR